MTGDFNVKTSPTQLFLYKSPVIPSVELVNVHPLIKNLFSKEMLTKVVELKEMLRKGVIKRTQPAQGEFLSNLFLLRKNDGGYRPIISLKMLNQFIPFLHFKMEDLSLFSVKALNTGGRLDAQTGPEGCIL